MDFTYNFAEVNRKVPMIEFLNSLTVKERAKISAHIDKLIELKNLNIPPKENLSKYLDEEIFELRVNFKDRIATCFYFYTTDKQIIFNSWFYKERAKDIKNLSHQGLKFLLV